MKTGTVILVISILLIAGFSSVQPDEIDRLKKENTILKSMIGPPPSSLDSLYPPIVQAPLYQIKMLEMAAPLTEILPFDFADLL